MRTVHPLAQGSDAWHQFRLEHNGASEAAAVLGLSKTTTRSELLRMKHTGIAREFSEWVQSHILDRGHEVEKLAISHVEDMINDTLYPVTCSIGKISASCDGLTLGNEIAWEHKQYAEALFASVKAGRVPEEHMPQCQQVLMVTGAGKLIFTASDGTPERMVHAEVLPDPAWFERIRAAWAQFDIDLAAGAPPERAAPAAVATPVESLPAVLVRMSGALTVTTNLDAFGAALRGFIAKIPEKPSTDQEFADTDAACKALKKAEEALAAEEDRALAGMSDVEQMRCLVADLRALARTTRLAREKMVEARKLEIRTEEVNRGKNALAEFVNGLNATIGKPYMPPTWQADFGLAIKGLRSLDSVRAAIDQRLADAKIAANAIAGGIVLNLRHLRENAADYVSLFPDVASLVLKPADDLAAVVSSRIAEHKAKESARIEAETARIRAEEQAKAQREAAAQAAAKVAADAAADLQARRDSEAAARAANPPMPVAVPPVAVVTARPVPRTAPASEPATLNLGAICSRLGFNITAAFVADTLGIQHAATDKSAKLFRESDFPRICDALVRHIAAVSELQAA